MAPEQQYQITIHPQSGIEQNSKIKLSSLPFEWAVLNAFEEAVKETGIKNSWLATGLVYRPFWNERFGPMQDGMDKDVQVAEDTDKKPLLSALQRIRPDFRWSVENRVGHTTEKYGVKTDTLEQSLLIFPLRFREGAIRTRDGQLEILMSAGALEDLQNGIVQIDEQLFQLVPENMKAKVLEEALIRAHKTIREYPGLALKGRILELYEARYGEYIPAEEIITDWEKIMEEVWEHEHGGRTRWVGMSFQQAQIATAEFVPFFLHSKKEPSAPPRPIPAHLPDILEDARTHREETGTAETKVIPPPDGFSSWFHYTTRRSPDKEYKEWLLNQARSRRPVGGRDNYLEQVLSYQLFQHYLEQRGITKPQQKLTHQGWELNLHLLETSYQLETDEVVERINPSEQDSLRMTMRLAMIFHDVGKIINIDTPGAHETISAKMWSSTKPDWVTEQEAKLVASIISTHDLLGRMERAIVEKKDYKIGDDAFDVAAKTTYTGGLDPSEIKKELADIDVNLKTALAVHKQIWRADVGAVPSLRWLLPVANTLERIVLAN